MVEYLSGVNPWTGGLPLLHNLGTHHVQLLLLVVEVVVEAAQLRAVVTHRKVLMLNKIGQLDLMEHYNSQPSSVLVLGVTGSSCA